MLIQCNFLYITLESTYQSFQISIFFFLPRVDTLVLSILCRYICIYITNYHKDSAYFDIHFSYRTCSGLSAT